MPEHLKRKEWRVGIGGLGGHVSPVVFSLGPSLQDIPACVGSCRGLSGKPGIGSQEPWPPVTDPSSSQHATLSVPRSLGLRKWSLQKTDQVV